MWSNKAVNILGLNFPVLNYEKTLGIFQKWAESRVAHQVCIANVYTVVTSLWDKELKTINNNSFCTMDGVPLVWYANLVHNTGIEGTVSGPNLMLKSLERGRNFGWKHFFLGGSQSVVNDLVDSMFMRFPGIEVVGWYSPPFRPLSEEEDQQLVELINTANPDFLWVGLGAPSRRNG